MNFVLGGLKYPILKGHFCLNQHLLLETAFYILIYALLIYLGICVVYFMVQERVIFIDFFKTHETADIAAPHEELLIETPADGRIHGLLIHSKEKKGLIFYLHGNTGNINRWKFMGEELTSFGYDVFVPDYRGYGKSRGLRTETNMHRDMEIVLDHLTAQNRYAKIVLYGRSLGSGFAVRLATQRPCDHLILETPYYSLLHVATSRFPFLPVRLLLRFEFRSDKYIEKVLCPIAIFHGTKDAIVPYRSGFKLYEKIRHRSDCEMVTLVGGKHNNLNIYPLFREKLGEILA